MVYKLLKEYTGHEQDVRSLDITSNGEIISGSRDGSLRRFSSLDTRLYCSLSTFINAVKTYKVPKGNNFNNEGEEIYLCGGTNKKILCLGSQDFQQILYQLEGHTDNISSIDAIENYILSGSWDKKVILYENFQKKFTLLGHTLAVWSVKICLEKQWIFTAGADKFIKIWDLNNGTLIKNIQCFDDCVRCIDLVDGFGFIACSNDSSIKLFNFEFKIIFELYGHTNYIYSVTTILHDGINSKFASVGEDRTLRIWQSGECIQVITLPALSIWSVKAFSNNDVAVGSSDGVIRVFTESDERVADSITLESFEKQVAAHTLPKTHAGEIDPSKLEGEEGLLVNGSKPGQVKMIKNLNGTIDAYQWDANNNQWIKVGQVMDSVSNKKQLYEGREYDFVFDINLDDNQPNLKLPFNHGDNVYNVATKFLMDHNLPIEYTEQIVDFLVKNTGPPPTINNSSNQYVDPYTGHSRYVSGGNVVNDSNNNNNNNNIKSVQPSAILTKLNFKSINLNQVLNKMDEFNKLVSKGEQFDEEQFQLLKLGETKDTTSILINILLNWSMEYKFPALDLLRYQTLKYSWYKELEPIQLLNHMGIGQVNNDIKLDKVEIILLMLGLKLLVNITFVENDLNFIDLELLIQLLRFVDVKLELLNVTTWNALVSLLINLSVIISSNTINDQLNELIQLIYMIAIKLLSLSNKDEEVIYRSLVTLLNCLILFKQNLKSNSIELKATLSKIQLQGKVNNLKDQLLLTLD